MNNAKDVKCKVVKLYSDEKDYNVLLKITNITECIHIFRVTLFNENLFTKQNNIDLFSFDFTKQIMTI